MSRFYTCARCNGRFHSDWSDEEAQAEYRAKFPDEPPTEPKIELCDDCYRAFESWRAEEEGTAT